MRKVAISRGVICVLLLLIFFAFRNSEAQMKIESSDTYKGPTVTVSGNVIFPAFKEGQQIAINAKSSATQGPPDVASVTIFAPGEYSLRVPKNAGNVYITVIVLEPGQFSPGKNSVAKTYINNPLKVGRSNIKDINFEIGGKSAMDTYKGPTVAISGRILFPAFKEGQQIRINAKDSAAGGPPFISSVAISAPGEYSLKVPQNSGNVYITAVVLDAGQFSPGQGTLKIKYNKGLPVRVEASDISGVDIAI